MQRLLVMTVIGPDRPGLVESVATLVARHGGNWLESRMSRLGGQFAGILRIEMPGAAETPFREDLAQLQQRGLRIVVQEDQPASAPAEARFSVLEIVGQDRPGIVKEIARVLAAHRVNVEELETECSSAAMSGETLFRARAKLSLPGGCDLVVLRQELEKIAADLIAEITLADVEPKAL